MKYLATLLITLMLVPGAYAQTCPNAQLETQTFLTALPPQAVDERPLVAEVEVLRSELEPEKKSRLAFVKVIEPIKGNFKINQRFTVTLPHDGCARDGQNLPRGDYYIAGYVNDEGLFYGPWQGLDGQLYWDIENQFKDDQNLD